MKYESDIKERLSTFEEVNKKHGQFSRQRFIEYLEDKIEELKYLLKVK